MRREKGFTLVELIVVIAIVAVLAGVLMLAINPAALLAKSRDAKRLDDLDNLNKAISLALADGEITLAVASGNSGTGTQDVDGTGWVGLAPATGRTLGLAKFISTLPADPVNGACTDAGGGSSTCVYNFGATATGYEMTAVLESVDNAAKLTTDGGNQDAAYEIGTSLTILGAGGS